MPGDDAGADHVLGGADALPTRRALFTGRNRDPPSLALLLQSVADSALARGGAGRVLPYTEQLQACNHEGGVAANVVPDEAWVTLNHRYAPDRTEVEAQAFLHELRSTARARRR